MDLNSTNFLKDRLRQQAQIEGVTLTSEEEMYLDLAGSGRMEEANQALQQLKQSETIQQVGQKLAALLMNAYQKDLQSDPGAKARYTEAIQSLAGHHSIFRLVLPLIFAQGAHAHIATHVPGNVPSGPPSGVPEIKSESSLKPFMLLLVFVVLGLLLWLVWTRVR